MQHHSHKLLQTSLPVDRSVLRFRLEAQIEPQTGSVDRQSGLPQCVAAPVSLACNAQQSTGNFGNPSVLSGLSKPPAGNDMPDA